MLIRTGCPNLDTFEKDLGNYKELLFRINEDAVNNIFQVFSVFKIQLIFENVAFWRFPLIFVSFQPIGIVEQHFHRIIFVEFNGVGSF